MPLNIDDAIVSSLWQQKVYVSCVLCMSFDIVDSIARKYLLVKTSNQRVWRRSSFGDYGLLRMGQNGRPASSAVPKYL